MRLFPFSWFEPNQAPEVAGFQAGWSCCAANADCPRLGKRGVVCAACAAQRELPPVIKQLYEAYCRKREHQAFLICRPSRAGTFELLARPAPAQE